MDRFAYGHDEDGHRLYRDNLVNSTFGELYHADGPTQGYDDLDRLTAFARGSLTDTSGDDVPDAVPSPTFGLIIYKGRGGSAGSASYPPKRPLAGAGAVALPIPDELLDDVVADVVATRLLLA